MEDRRRFIGLLPALGAGAAAVATVASTSLWHSHRRSDGFPSRLVKWMTPLSAGGGPDAAMRALAKALALTWDVPVVVENRPGDTGVLAAEAFRESRPDGHELLLLDSAHVCTQPLLVPDLPYRPQRDFEPVGPILLTEFYAAVPKDSPFQSLSEIVEAARAHPGTLRYASWHVGSPGHLGALRLEALAGIRMTHRPYPSVPLAVSAVAEHEVDWALLSQASAGAAVRSGHVRMITLGGPNRSALLPDVPSADESPTTRGFEISAWVGAFAPPGTPAPVKDEISSDMRAALRSPALREHYRRAGYQVPDLDPAGFADRIRLETETWKATIDGSGLSLR